MCENAYLSIKNPKASRALKWALDPGHRMLASLVRLRFAMSATFGLRSWPPPLTKSWIRTCVPVWKIQDPPLPTNDFPLRIQICGKEYVRVCRGGGEGSLWVINRFNGYPKMSVRNNNGERQRGSLNPVTTLSLRANLSLLPLLNMTYS